MIETGIIALCVVYAAAYWHGRHQGFQAGHEAGEIHEATSLIRTKGIALFIGADSMFKIDDGIPVAPVQKTSKYPVADLEVGQSFFVPLDGKTSTGIQGALNSAAKPERAKGKSFVTRTITEDGVEGVRIWRVEAGEGDNVSPFAGTGNPSSSSEEGLSQTGAN